MTKKPINSKKLDFTKMKIFFIKISNFLSLLFEKLGYFLTHNIFVYVYPKKVRLFGIKFNITRSRRDAYYGYMFILLWLIGFLIFTLYPMFYSFYLSLHEAYYNLQEGITSIYIGFENLLIMLHGFSTNIRNKELLTNQPNTYNSNHQVHEPENSFK